VIEGGKRLVLLLNKIDLVPRENVERWLQYLRRQLPTVAFKASTQEQATKLGRSSANVRTSKCVGAEQLMTVLGNYCRNRDIKTAIRVGVIGYPNVGKSSVINSLKRKRSCNVGATPGVTRQIQEVELDKHIRMLDSPGVVLTSKSDMDAIEAALRNAIRIEAIEDPIIPVQAILRRCPAQSLMLHYSLPEFHSCEEFLALLARRLGRLKKGARPDLNAAARKVLNDWNGGQLRYHTQPPDVESGNEAVLCSAELLAQYSDEFQLDSVDDSTILQEVPMDSSIDMAMMNVGVTMEEAGAMTVMDERPLKKRGPVIEKSSEHELPQSLAMGENLQLNKAIKKAVKERRRRDKKQGKRAERLADIVQATSLSDRMDIA